MFNYLWHIVEMILRNHTRMFKLAYTNWFWLWKHRKIFNKEYLWSTLPLSSNTIIVIFQSLNLLQLFPWKSFIFSIQNFLKYVSLWIERYVKRLCSVLFYILLNLIFLSFACIGVSISIKNVVIWHIQVNRAMHK